MCPEHPELEARQISCSNGRMAKSVCSVSCYKPGFRLSGNETTSCQVRRVNVDNKKVLLSNEHNQKLFNLEVLSTKELAFWNVPLATCERETTSNN